ncbi:4173_t:CDS:1, partial [Racocetra fulgida]
LTHKMTNKIPIKPVNMNKVTNNINLDSDEDSNNEGSIDSDNTVNEILI